MWPLSLRPDCQIWMVIYLTARYIPCGLCTTWLPHRELQSWTGLWNATFKSSRFLTPSSIFIKYFVRIISIYTRELNSKFSCSLNWACKRKWTRKILDISGAFRSLKHTFSHESYRHLSLIYRWSRRYICNFNLISLIKCVIVTFRRKFMRFKCKIKAAGLKHWAD